ncbi:Gfo/Idh/MocA family oxidoreductase [Tissierella sp. Yu-01]|uniref:Gfo/Idh/MocA family protein n=1 Tax=Tissierella sp. Yu-01 TaxID=3035694 RepID=UPI00240D59F8|nr:Gfo/Idh/MocA family oxidoreductase [Tissierella sp. Yu-01]WFA08794.1 Gfo/Idh/MocA family oxidoreductase [Tissierella sp. Yu-01]
MKKTRIGLIGYGYIGKIHTIGYTNIPLIFPHLSESIEMTKVIRQNKSPKDEQQWLNRGINIEELSCSNIDLVDICTPNFLHLSQIQYLLNNGINIYCEKPLGLNYQECIHLTNLVEEKKIINQVALVYRFMPSIAKARAFIKNGGIGDIINFRSHLLHSSYLNPYRNITWRLEKEKSGGGALVDLGIHLIDTIRFLLGETKSLSADTRTLFNKRPDGNGKDIDINVDEWGIINLEMVSGAKGTAEVSKVSINPFDTFNIEIYGTKGYLKITNNTFYDPITYKFNSNENTVENASINENGIDDYVKYLSTIIPSSKMSLGSLLDLHIASILNLLKNIEVNKIIYGETPTFRESSKSQKLIDYAYISSSEGGRKIKV